MVLFDAFCITDLRFNGYIFWCYLTQKFIFICTVSVSTCRVKVSVSFMYVHYNSLSNVRDDNRTFADT